MVKIVFMMTEIKSQNARVWLRWNPVDNWVSCVLWQRNALWRSWVTLLEELFCWGCSFSNRETRDWDWNAATMPCISDWTKINVFRSFLEFFLVLKKSRFPNSFIYCIANIRSSSGHQFDFTEKHRLLGLVGVQS